MHTAEAKVAEGCEVAGQLGGLGHNLPEVACLCLGPQGRLYAAVLRSYMFSGWV